MSGITIAERWARVDALDLEPVVYTLINAEPGERLTLAEADEAIVLYRAFLKLCVAAVGRPLVPTVTIDLAWHAHIGDTHKYGADCMAIAGGPLDHWPYAGAMSEVDQRRVAEDRAFTRDRFGDLGIELTGEWAPTCCTGSTHGQPPPPRPRPDRSLVGAFSTSV